MQRVVRLSFAGLLAFAGAGLTACGDKVTIPAPVNPAVDSVVHSVTVSPAAASVAVGASIQLAASVDAGAGVTVRTVTWSSSDATIASVDASGKVTGVKGGTATIIAKSTKDPNVSGAAAITVTGGGVPTVTISSVNQTTCGLAGCTSTPANLGNAGQQLDITLNVDAQGQTITSVTALIKCGNDTASASQSISNLAPVAAEASAVPVTLSINTAAFNSTTGVPKLHNGACTMSATAKTASGSQSATNNTPVTINNADMVIVKAKNSGATATDPNGASWGAGDLTVTAIPVVYSGTTLATANLGFAGATPASQNVPVTGSATAGFTASASWSATATGTAPSVKNVTLGTSATPVSATANFVDAQGNNLNPPTVAAPISSATLRLDNQAPPAATVDTLATGTPGTASDVNYARNTQGTAANWTGKAFTFTKALAIGTTAKLDNNGVDKVTFTTQWAPHGTTTWTTFSDVNTLAETSTSTTYDLRVVVCDALNNCANSPVVIPFGVDLTAPTSTTAIGPAANAIAGIGQRFTSLDTVAGKDTIAVSATDPQGANGVIGSGFGPFPVSISMTNLNPNATATGQAVACTIGSAASPAGTGCKATVDSALTVIATVGQQGQFAATYTVHDQAGNTATTTNLNFYLDRQTAPSMSGGISIPASIVAGSAFTASGVDSMDFAGANGFLHYTNVPGGTGKIAMPATASPVGVAFDNTLTRASTATLTLPAAQFYRSMSVITAAVISGNVKPDFVGIRGLDAANNLSLPDSAALPPTNIATGTPPVIGTDLADFTLAPLGPTTISNGTSTAATPPKSVTLNAVVTATGPQAGTPFTSVCFYIQTPGGLQGGQGDKVTQTAAGDLALLNCTSTFNTTLVGTLKQITASFTFDPASGYGIAGTLNVFAVGVTAAGDAVLISTPAVITLAN